MRPKIADDVPLEAWTLFEEVRRIITALPPLLEGEVFLFGIKIDKETAVKNYIPNCHVVTEALGKFLPLDPHHGLINTWYRDGKLRKLQHAWLTLRGLDEWIVIDPWPLGVVSGPALFIQDYSFHFGQKFSLLKTPEFESDLETVVKAIRA